MNYNPQDLDFAERRREVDQDEYARLTARIDELESERDDLESEIIRLRGELDDTYRDRDALETELNEERARADKNEDDAILCWTFMTGYPDELALAILNHANTRRHPATDWLSLVTAELQKLHQ